MPEQGNYAVGYKKPPKSGQFQKGTSGNPAGRSKGALNLATQLRQALAERVTVTENGRRRTVTKQEVMVTVAVNKAAGGDTRTFLALIGLLAASEQIEGQVPEESTSQQDQQIYRNLLKRLNSPMSGASKTNTKEIGS